MIFRLIIFSYLSSLLQGKIPICEFKCNPEIYEKAIVFYAQKKVEKSLKEINKQYPHTPTVTGITYIINNLGETLCTKQNIDEFIQCVSLVEIHDIDINEAENCFLEIYMTKETGRLNTKVEENIVLSGILNFLNIRYSQKSSIILYYNMILKVKSFASLIPKYNKNHVKLKKILCDSYKKFFEDDPRYTITAAFKKKLLSTDRMINIYDTLMKDEIVFQQMVCILTSSLKNLIVQQKDTILNDICPNFKESNYDSDYLLRSLYPFEENNIIATSFAEKKKIFDAFSFYQGKIYLKKKAPEEHIYEEI